MIRAETDMFMFEAIFRTCLTHQLIIVSIIKSGISEIHELEFLFLTGALLSSTRNSKLFLSSRRWKIKDLFLNFPWVILLISCLSIFTNYTKKEKKISRRSQTSGQLTNWYSNPPGRFYSSPSIRYGHLHVRPLASLGPKFSDSNFSTWLFKVHVMQAFQTIGIL